VRLLSINYTDEKLTKLEVRKYDPTISEIYIQKGLVHYREESNPWKNGIPFDNINVVLVF